MTGSQISNKLTSLGLTESESKVYLAMLKLGPNTVQNIAKASGLSRTATYQVISSLETKGLVSTFTEKKRKLFAAEDPENLERYFSQHVQEMQGILSSFNHFIPELRALHTDRQEPRVRMYRGNESIRALFRDLAAVNPPELLEITNVDAVYSAVDPQILLEERERFAKSDIKVKVLQRGAARALSDKAEYRDFPHKTLNFQGDIWIYGNRIAFTHFLNTIETVIIDNAVFADTMRAIFLVVWHCSDNCSAKCTGKTTACTAPSGNCPASHKL